MLYYNKTYGIDAYLFADIGTIILVVLYDCIGSVFSCAMTHSEGFIKSCAAWVNHLSKSVQVLIDLKCFASSPVGRSDSQ